MAIQNYQVQSLGRAEPLAGFAPMKEADQLLQAAAESGKADGNSK